MEREQTRSETLARARSELGVRLMQFAQPEIIGICLALAPLELPPYVLLWIVDWLPRYDLLPHRKKIHLIESVVKSIRNIKGSQSILFYSLVLNLTIAKKNTTERTAVRQRFGLRQRAVKAQ